MSELIKSGRAVIEGDEIVIRVAIEALPVVVDAHPSLGGAYRVTHALDFARELERALSAEEEDGTTLVHRMFDRAIEDALEYGAEGIEERASADGKGSK